MPLIPSHLDTPIDSDDEVIYAKLRQRLLDHDVPTDRLQEFWTMVHFWYCDPYGDYKWNNEDDVQTIRNFLEFD
jgi:hypothetical protein